MKSIKFYQSKTFWFNVVAILVFVVDWVTATDSAFHLSASAKSILLLAIGVGNLALRLFSTDKPIQGTNAPMVKGK